MPPPASQPTPLPPDFVLRLLLLPLFAATAAGLAYLLRRTTRPCTSAASYAALSSTDPEDDEDDNNSDGDDFGGSDDRLAHADAILRWLAVPIAVVVCAAFGMVLNGGRHYVLFLRRGEANAAGGDKSATPESTASLLSLLTFSWMTSLISKGETKTLAMTDLWQLRETDGAMSVWQRFHKHRPGRSLFATLILVARKTLTLQYAAALLTPFLTYAGPLMLNLILAWFEDPDRTLLRGWWLLLCMLVINVASAVSGAQQYFHGRRVGLTVYAAVIGELYAKALRRPAGVSSGNGARSEEAVDSDLSSGKSDKPAEINEEGNINTMMTVDVERIVNFSCFSHDLVLTLPLSIILAFLALYWVIGLSAVAGIAVIAINAPLTAYLGSFMEDFQAKLLKESDKRVTMTTEILNSIRIIKYFGWEDQFAGRLLKVRDAELGLNPKTSLLWIFTSLLTYCTSILCLFATFATYTIVAGHPLTAATAFTTVILLERVGQCFVEAPFYYFWLLKKKVSLERVDKFLSGVELDRYAQSGTAERVETVEEADALDDAASVGFRQAAFRHFDPADASRTVESVSAKQHRGIEAAPPSESVATAAFTLQGIDISFRKGGLNVVTGPTGSGKSSLILALLGETLPEMKKVAGDVHLPKHDGPGLVSYVAQTAWLLNATIRENITMGLPLDDARYRKTLEACALVRDLETLPGGDLTEVGEKGISLSGGQKQRIALARAVYSMSLVVLLDDPLSAVDAPTAKHLMANAIQKSLAGRTVILVTHAVGLAVRAADYVVVMGGGTVVAQGTPIEVASNPSAVHITASSVEPTEYLSSNDADKQKAVLAKDGDATRLVEDEEKEVGRVKWSVYVSYFAAAGVISSAISVVLLVFQDVLGVASDAWIAKWTEDVRRNSTLIQSSDGSSIGLWLFPSATSLWYKSSNAIVSATYSVEYIRVDIQMPNPIIGTALIQSLRKTLAAYRASRIIHEHLLNSVLGAPLRFFETTPMGRILNRFTKDISSVDGEVILEMLHFANTATKATTIVLVVCFFSPFFLLALIPIGFVYYSITQSYLRSSRELKRLDSVSVSPVISNFNETLHGASTFGSPFRKKRGRQSVAQHPQRHAAYRSVTPGWAGVTLLYAALFSDAVLWLVRSHADMEMGLNSVERCNAYSRLEQEPPRVIEGYRPGPEWPEAGVVEVNGLSVRYAADLPLVLKNVSFATAAGERIGVVGRTGTGKSTLSLAFFRIIPHAAGTILIDGMDINRMGLHDLRSRLTIIPQDPILFNGTIRSNLDPLGESSDADLWRVLRETHLLESLQSQESVSTITADRSSATTLASDSFSLDSPVLENGSNFSQGQCQLLCLARALLRRSRVIFLDEATASIDAATDSRIQRTIREQLSGTTVFCIAHRLRTVVDFDRVLVLDAGEVVQFGTPMELMAGSGATHFARMCEDSGEMEVLLEMAREAEERKRRRLRVAC
ncbi:P-loop containing nucleoside triphosphate hydrolase protein [Zopfochytrium polystomum]|nr:P-loop containing nucleoside triphosphate hydrolase protein [Zopfochytrium polystomum]